MSQVANLSTSPHSTSLSASLSRSRATEAPTYAGIRDSCLPAIERHLSWVLQHSLQDNAAYNAQMAHYHLSTGGKRLRALIPCWVYAACGHDPRDAVPLGCAVEMVHNATLVHDDLQDGDCLRRGMPTVWRKYSSAQSINCGDAMYHFAMQMLLELPFEPSRIQRMMLRFIRGVTQVIEGQAQEFLLKDEVHDPAQAGGRPVVSRYLEVARGKTGALLATSLGIAVESLGKSPEFCQEIERIGVNLGVLFQMQDDLLDVYGDKGRDRPATDIAEGKISVLIAQLLEDASAPDRDFTLRVLRKPREETQDSEILDVISLFDRYQTRNAVIHRIRAIHDSVKDASFLRDEPELHGALCEMSGLFLKPIRHLMETTP